MPYAVKCLRTLYQIHVANSSVKQLDTKQDPKSRSLPSPASHCGARNCAALVSGGLQRRELPGGLEMGACYPPAVVT